MKIFLTGGTGFIGSHFINEAHNNGHEVFALRRLGSLSRIKLNKEPIWINGSLDGNYVKELSKCDVYIHLATFGASPQPSNWSECFYWNVIKSVELLKQALDSGINKVISVGTYAEYGKSGMNYEFIPPNCPLSPEGPYAASKAAFGIAMRSICAEYDSYSIYYRLFSIFGDGQNEKNFYPALKKAALSGNDFSMTKGEQIRDFFPVDLAVKQICEGIKFENVGINETKILNIGSGTPRSVLKFAQDNWIKFKAKGKLNVGSLPYRKNEIMRYVASIYE